MDIKEGGIYPLPIASFMKISAVSLSIFVSLTSFMELSGFSSK